LSVSELATSAQPAGVAIAASAQASPRAFVAVSNTAANSVSIFAEAAGGASVALQTTLQNVSGPSTVVECTGGVVSANPQFLVAQPAANSITLINTTAVQGTLPVGREPGAAACYLASGQPMAVVSNFGDSTLSLIDVSRRTVVASIPNVPGTRSLKGIAIQDGRIAWVLGTDANRVTIVDLTERRVTGSLSMQRPTSIVATVTSSGGIGTQTTFGISTAGGITYYNAVTQQVISSFVVADVQYFSPFGSSGALLVIRRTGDTAATLVLIQNNALVPVPQVVNPTFVSGSYVISAQSNKLYYVFPTPAAPLDFAIVNAATFQGTNSLAPGALASLFAPSTGLTQNFAADSLPLPRSLGGVTLILDGQLQFNNFRWTSVGGVEAPLLFAGPGQINFQIPPTIDQGNPLAPRIIPAILRRPDGTTLTSSISLRASAPGIFFRSAGGQTQPAIINQDGSQNGVPGATLPGRPAPRGSVILIYATGPGATTPPLLPGEPAPPGGDPLALTNVQPAVLIGGFEARVLFSGMAPGFVGLWQLNVEIPADVEPGNAVPLTVSASGASSNLVTIAVQ
jgi:uncharacterized protein (TIGR03437 family)